MINLIDWKSMPLMGIRLDRLVYPCHDINPAHLHGTDPSLILSRGPIYVEQLVDGSYFIHDGRHRVLRAMNDGDIFIEAYVLSQYVHPISINPYTETEKVVITGGSRYE